MRAHRTKLLNFFLFETGDVPLAENFGSRDDRNFRVDLQHHFFSCFRSFPRGNQRQHLNPSDIPFRPALCQVPVHLFGNLVGNNAPELRRDPRRGFVSFYCIVLGK